MSRNHRQEGVFDFEAFSALRKSIVGVGAIGGFVTKSLSYMSIPNVRLYDHDGVEEHNLGTQGFRPSDLDNSKVTARLFDAAPYLDAETQETWTLYPHRWQQHQADVVFLCVDSLQARRQIYEYYKDKDTLIVDTRMLGLQYQVYTVTPSSQHRERYEETLSEEGLVEGSCTTRSTLHAASIAAGIALTTAMTVVSQRPAPFLIHQEMWGWEGEATW